MMTPNELEYRRRVVLESIRPLPHHHKNPTWLHKYSYEQGHICCTNCRKWLDPNNAEDAEEIGYQKNRRPFHKTCPVRSISPAAFCTTAKSHGRNKKMPRILKRY